MREDAFAVVAPKASRPVEYGVGSVGILTRFHARLEAKIETSSADLKAEILRREVRAPAREKLPREVAALPAACAGVLNSLKPIEMFSIRAFHQRRDPSRCRNASLSYG